MDERIKKIAPYLLFIAFSLFINIDLLKIDNPVFVYKDHDDNWYGLTMHHALERGCAKGIPVSFFGENLKNFHSCTFLKIWGSLIPSSDPNIIFLWVSALGRILSLLVFFIIGQLFLSSPVTGTLIGTAYLLDPHLTAFKPFLSMTKDLINGSSQFPRLFRNISPLHYAIPANFISIAIFAVHLDKWTVKKGTIVTLPMIILMAMTPFYVWIPYLSLFGVLFVYQLFLDKNKVYTKYRFTGSVILSSLVFIVIFLIPKLGIEHQAEALLRSAFIKGQFLPLFLLHKSFLFTLSMLGLLLYNRTKNISLSLLAFLTPLLILNINVLTGIEYQNFHFKDYLAPIIFTFFFIYFYQVYKKTAVSIALFYCVVSLFNLQIHSERPTSFKSMSPNIEDNKDLLEFVGKLPSAKVYCSDFNYIIPLVSQHRCFYNHLLMTYAFPPNKLMELNVIKFAFENKTPEEVRAITSQPQPLLATYHYGIKKEWGEEYEAKVRFTSKDALNNYGEKWKNFYTDNKVSLLKKYKTRFDLFLFKNNSELPYGDLILIKSFKNYSIFKNP